MKITFVLLLSTGKDIELATTILIPSIYHFFKINDIFEIIIIVRDKDYPLLINKINIKDDIKFKIIKDSEIYPNYSSNKINSYYLQMFMKLKISNMIETEFYLTLDADIFFCGKTDINDLVKENKAIYQKYNCNDVWTVRSIKYLEYQNNENKIINQTPFIFVNKLVKKLLNEVNVEDAILNKKCSEYSLYYIFLLKNNLFENNYYYNTFIGNTISYPINKIGTPNMEKMLYISFRNKKHKINCIQSRLNIHDYFIDVLKHYIPNSNFKKLKIGVITAVSDDMYYKKYEKAINIKRLYCNYHKYDFLFHKFDNKEPKKSGWIKITLLNMYLQKYDYIFLSDADVVITNRDIRLEEIIYKYFDSNTNVLTTTDFNSINTGNTIWKNTPNSKYILNQIIKVYDKNYRYNKRKPYIPKGIYEQPTIIYLINTNRDIRNSIKIIPQYEMNSYHKVFVLKKNNIMPIINGIANRSYWKKGDFLIHFAGLNTIINNKFKLNIDKFINTYSTFYFNLLKSKEGEDHNKIK